MPHTNECPRCDRPWTCDDAGPVWDQEDSDFGEHRTDHDLQIRSYSTRRIPAVAPQM